MAVVGKPFRVHYTARDRKTGLTDVRMVVYKPNGTKLGVYALSELDVGDGSGIYFHDFVDADIEGTYLFLANSVSWSWDTPPRQEYFHPEPVVTDTDLTEILTLLRFVKDIEGGKWAIEGTQMVFYKSDNTTEVARFNLFNQAGIAAYENVFKRERV